MRRAVYLIRSIGTAGINFAEFVKIGTHRTLISARKNTELFIGAREVSQDIEPPRADLGEQSNADHAFHNMYSVNDICKTAKQTHFDGHLNWALAALQSMPDEMCAKDLEGRIMAASKAMASRYGFAHPDDLIGKTSFDYLPNKSARELNDTEGRIVRSGQPELNVEHAIRDAKNRLRWVQSSSAPLYDHNEFIIGIVSVSRDITAWKEEVRLMLAQANLLDMVAQAAPISNILTKIVAIIEEHMPGMTGSIWLVSQDGTTFEQPMAPNTSNTCLDILAKDPASPIVRIAWSAIAHAADVIVPDVFADPQWLLDREAPAATDIRAFWSSPIFSCEGRPLGVFNLCSSMVATAQDVQMDLIAMAAHMVSAAVERKEAAERTKFLASHDMLTGLPNRRMFEEQLECAIEAAHDTQSHVALAFFDLDNFKLINDSLGHGAGDELLKIVAERAKYNFRSGDLVGRLGGDEFVMFLKAKPNEAQDLRARFTEIRRAISAPLSLAGRTLQVTCSMGVAYFPDHALTSSDLVMHADAAMYRAKTFGRDNIQFFSNEMADFAKEELILNTELRAAISRRELILYYQPQVNSKTRHIFGAEALVRWRHPTRGLLSPRGFIKNAEDTGLIVPIGDWILFEACRQNKMWQNEGHLPIVVGVNVSARQFQEPNFVGRVEAAIEQSGLEACYLELELTESLVMQDGALAVKKMRELEKLGVQFSIDDFGTGYSRLSFLNSMPVRRLKIGRSFIAGIPHDEGDNAITAAIIAMALTLKLRIIAEGVETLDQLEFLDAHDCHEIQGFFYSKPVDAEAFEDLLTGGEQIVQEHVGFETVDRIVPRLADS